MTRLLGILVQIHEITKSIWRVAPPKGAEILSDQEKLVESTICSTRAAQDI